jgi:hypothetical protein
MGVAMDTDVTVDTSVEVEVEVLVLVDIEATVVVVVSVNEVTRQLQALLTSTEPNFEITVIFKYSL